MKTRYVLLAVFGLSSVVLASFIVPYDFSEPPSLPLPVAYERVLTALGPLTNQYHCISAKVSSDYTGDAKNGEWDFTFVTPTPTNGTPRMKWVTIYFDGKIRFDVNGFR